MTSSKDASVGVDGRLRLLYPQVDERVTPLPRCWSSKDKFNYIALSSNNLRVQYKGHGKTHKDASAIRATHSVPASCGLYYFEIRVVSKGRDGYMGVGLSAQGVNMNRLPGWDKYSYGYHGDDGHSFCSSGTGQPYGPTFTTGDVIGCGLNLVEHTCFYTKNGTNLGVAFRNMPPNLYPTVGLQTPGEIVDANFGQRPFVFDIETEINELRTGVRTSIENFTPSPQALGIAASSAISAASALSASSGAWQVVMHKLVSAYLEHEAFAAATSAFNTSTAQASSEAFHCIKARQRLMALVRTGRVGKAVAVIRRLYPRLLNNNPKLHFRLRVRQFVEMVADACQQGRDGLESKDDKSDGDHDGKREAMEEEGVRDTERKNEDVDIDDMDEMDDDEDFDLDNDPAALLVDQASQRDAAVSNGSNNNRHGNDRSSNSDPEVMADTDGIEENNLPMEVGTNGNNEDVAIDSSSEVMDPSLSMNLGLFNRLLRFGRQVFVLYDSLKSKKLSDASDKQLLDDAFALLAYAKPFESPLRYLLTANERESVATALNEAILESKKMPKKTLLQSVVDESNHLLALMAANDMGACAFASLDDIVNK